MEKALGLSDFRANIKTYLIDFSLLLFIYFLPALSHLFAFPIYYLDPMRIAISCGSYSYFKEKYIFNSINASAVFVFYLISPANCKITFIKC